MSSWCLMPKLQESGMIDPAYEEEINYEGPSGLIDTQVRLRRLLTM